MHPLPLISAELFLARVPESLLHCALYIETIAKGHFISQLELVE